MRYISAGPGVIINKYNKLRTPKERSKQIIKSVGDTNPVAFAGASSRSCGCARSLGVKVGAGADSDAMTTQEITQALSRLVEQGSHLVNSVDDLRSSYASTAARLTALEATVYKK